MFKSVLILDDDLGFVFWLGELLSSAGCEAVPARNVLEAKARIGTLNLTIDLVVANPLLAGVAEFIRTLRRDVGHLSVIEIIPAIGESKTRLRGIDGVQLRPCVADDHAKAEWLNTVRAVHRADGREIREIAV